MQTTQSELIRLTRPIVPSGTKEGCVFIPHCTAQRGPTIEHSLADAGRVAITVNQNVSVAK